MGWFEITSKNHENDRHIVYRGETFGGTKTTKVYDKATGKTGEGYGQNADRDARDDLASKNAR